MSAPASTSDGLPASRRRSRDQDGVVAGPGGQGKSRLTLQIALSAAATEDDSLVAPFKGTGHEGLHVAGGPVVAVGYEDHPGWLRWRLERIANHLDGGGDLNGRHIAALKKTKRLSVAQIDRPLFAPPAHGRRDALPGPTSTWRQTWNRAAEIDAGLVIIDPVGLALEMVGFDPTPVNAFYRALRVEAGRIKCAVLLVAHVTKLGRGMGADINADAISAVSTIAARLMAVVDLVGREYSLDSSGWWYQRTEYGGLIFHASEGGERLDQMACRLLAEIPAGDGLAALTVTVETGALVELDDRQTVVLGGKFDGAPAPEDEAELMRMVAAVPDSDPATLFELAPAAELVPSYLLQTYAQSGGPFVTPGRGGAAPLRQRIWLDGLTNLRTTDRTGDMRRFAVPLGELIDHWWPYGWDYRMTGKQWDGLVHALEGVSMQRLAYRDRHGVVHGLHVLVFTDYPLEAPSASALRNTTLRGAITLPEGAGKGPTISRAVLQHAGTISGPTQRLAVAWAFYRGRYLSQNGFWTPPTLPRTQQDEQRRYLDSEGRIILDRYGRPTTRFMHPRVVMLDADGVPVAKLAQAARVRNPALDRAPPFSLNQWRHAAITHPAEDRRQADKERKRLLRGWYELRDAGIVGLDELPGCLIRPIPPGALGRSPSVRELRADHDRRIERKAQETAREA